MKIGPQYKISRRLGERIFPKTQTTKFTVSGAVKKTSGKRGRKNVTEYGSQLLEKQKARYTYVVSEKQFSNYVKKARVMKGTTPAVSLYQQLEKRLDNVVFRLGLVPSRLFARQVVSHGHIMVNGRRVLIPSYEVRTGDIVSIRPQSRENGVFRNLIERLATQQSMDWLSYDLEKNQGVVKGEPTAGRESNINFGVILEYYSRV